MHAIIRKTAFSLFLAAGVALAFAAVASAQQPQNYPEYIYVGTTGIRPGMLHAYLAEDAKSAAADKAANMPIHYSAWESISGPETVSYVIDFNTFAELQQWHQAAMADTKAQAVQHEVATAEAPMMTFTTAAFFHLDKDQSSPDMSSAQNIFAEVTYYHIRPGQEDNWNRLVALYKKALLTAVPDAHWLVYDEMYGDKSGDTVMIVDLMTSLQHIDLMHDEDAKMSKAVGKEQMQMLQVLFDKIVTSSESNLYVLNKDASYMPSSAQ